MRLSEWRGKAPVRDRIDNPVMVVLEPLLADFGADPDPHCYVAWGEDPERRFSILVAVPAGFVSIAVRTSGGAEEARATARLVRWSKLAIGEFSVDATGEHRVVAVQVESFVLKGTDAEADLISEFVRGLVLRADDRAATLVTADLAKALTQALDRNAAAAAVAPAAAGRAAAAGSSRVAATRPAPPRPVVARRRRDQPKEISLESAAVRSAREAEAPRAPDPPAVTAATPELSIVASAVPDAVEGPAAPVVELLALAVVEPEPSSAAEGSVPAEPAPPAAPRKPRAPRKPATDAADKPKRPRRVHRQWPEPARAPAWDEQLTNDQRAKKKPQRWVP